eukprot:11076300-Alexandrium_andersonii.AAC.1
MIHHASAPHHEREGCTKLPLVSLPVFRDCLRVDCLAPLLAPVLRLALGLQRALARRGRWPSAGAQQRNPTRTRQCPCLPIELLRGSRRVRAAPTTRVNAAPKTAAVPPGTVSISSARMLSCRRAAGCASAPAFRRPPPARCPERAGAAPPPPPRTLPRSSRP